MAWVLKLEEVQDGRVVWSTKIMTLDRPARVDRLDDLGLRLAEGKALLAETQKRIVTRQFASERQARSTCPGCGEVQRLKDYRPRRFHTVFGSVVVRRARLKCTRCPRTDDGDALGGHSTPERCARSWRPTCRIGSWVMCCGKCCPSPAGSPTPAFVAIRVRSPCG